ncbi:hypothetical protein [Streptomyces lancefieldiae]|uniref:Uncharacterized protein n=1 Tax=Streptomyces lancefieldiae TaxID=3075520 RepID=A0ABU3B0C8_9ACTN|nr:hypothetical protein [Streptomyces sp. DSM 40712]MDT0615893.1 hypothetical protein [Streptomyces sp. DSM 40712]
MRITKVLRRARGPQARLAGQTDHHQRAARPQQLTQRARLTRDAHLHGQARAPQWPLHGGDLGRYSFTRSTPREGLRPLRDPNAPGPDEDGTD